MSKAPATYDSIATRNQLIASMGETPDYKALVCVFFFGATDSHNMYVPLTGINRTYYDTSRPPGVGIQINEEPTNVLGTSPNWRLHPNLPTLYEYWQNNRLAIVREIGTLNRPTTKEEYLANTNSIRPQALFAHNVQQDIWQAALKHGTLRSTGWFGRAARLIDGVANPDQVPPLGSFSTSGSRLQGFSYDNLQTSVVPPSVYPLGNTRTVVPTNSWSRIIELYHNNQEIGLDYTDPTSVMNRLYYAHRDYFVSSIRSQITLNEAYPQLPSEYMSRFDKLRSYRTDSTSYLIANHTHIRYIGTNYYDGSFTGGTGYNVSDIITLENGATIAVNAVSGGVVTEFTITDRGDPIFNGEVWNFHYSPAIVQDSTTGSGTGFTLTPNIDTVSTSAGLNGFRIMFREGLRVIYNRGPEALNQNRQFIFIPPGGWDHHTDLRPNQDYRLRDIDACIKAFKDCVEDMELTDNVTIFFESEFGRTFNGNPTNGTDHAWAGHMFVMGGEVVGGIYGPEPDYLIDGPRDTGRGRFIPQISTEQYYATLLQWFGVPSGLINLVLPNIGVFSPQNLGFMED